jgi:hypothetical protein
VTTRVLLDIGSRARNVMTSPATICSTGRGRITTTSPGARVSRMLGDSTVSAVPPTTAGTSATATASPIAASIAIPTIARSTAPGAPERLRSVVR